MKKIFSLLAAVLFAGSMMAADATMAAGTNGYDDFTVNGKPAVKIGTGSKGGDMSVTVGAGATSLTVYAAAWKGVSGLSLNITAPEGVTITPASINLAAEENFSGSEKAFTVADESAYKFDFVISGADAGATFTFTTSIAKRFLMWSATYETAGETPVDPGDEPVAEWAEITFTKATAAGVFNDTVFTVEGSEFSLKCVDTDGKLKTTANNASFGTVEDRHDYAFRLQTVGKSSSKNNMELNIPADGQLRFAVRTATASDETRTVVLVQGTDTIYNKVAVDKDTVEGASNPRIFNFAYVNVKAGKVAVSYPVNGVNFYSFAFKAGAAEEPVLADTLTCAQAAELAAAGKTDEVIVKGYVTEIAYAWASGSMSFWMADTKDGGKVFEAYKCAIAKAEDAVIVGDLVAAKGNLTYYPKTSTPELAAGCTVEILEAVERPVVEPAQNLGEKTIAEFLELANTKDTCILTGVIADVVNAQYGNFYLVEGTDSLYVYGLKDAAGAYCFEAESLAEGDTLKVLAIYSTYNNKPQAKNAIFVEVKKAVVVEHTYTVAGMESVFGTNWTPSDANNDMTKQEDGTYKWEKANLELAAGNVEFKVCEDHAWTVAYPAQNYVLAIEEAGIYTITITFDPANDNAVNAVATKTGSAEIDPVVSIAGSMNSWNASANVMTLAEDKATATLALNLEAQTYDFKVVLNGGEWRSNAQEFTRENASATNMTGNEDNMHLVADVAGEYVFTWTFADNSLAITYPEAVPAKDTIQLSWSSDKETVEWKDATASQGWWQMRALSDKAYITLSNAGTVTQTSGTYTVAQLDAKYSYMNLYKGTDTTRVELAEGSITVDDNGAGTVAISGTLTGDDGNVYEISIISLPDPYKFDEEEDDYDYNFESYNLNTTYAVSNSAVFVQAQTDTTLLSLYVIIPQGDTTLVAGEYDVVVEPAYGTVLAGSYSNNRFNSSFAATLYEEEGQSYYNQIWYLVSGKVTVDNNLNIVVDALNSNGKAVKANLKGKTTEGVEDVKAAQKATKALKNGILVIEKNGVQYNVTGQEIR